MDYLLNIRQQVLEGITHSSAVAPVLAGKPSPEIYQRYLINVWHYARHSSAVIALAGSRCVQSHPELADYLMHHGREELGHDAWALTDLAALGVSEEAVRASRPSPACAAMIGFEYFTAGHANPVGIFGWLYVLEAMGEDLGATVSARLREGLGLQKGVKFVEGHGEADVDHTRDLTEQISQHIHGSDLDDVHHVADVVGALYVQMFQQIGGDTVLSPAAGQ